MRLFGHSPLASHGLFFGFGASSSAVLGRANASYCTHPPRGGCLARLPPVAQPWKHLLRFVLGSLLYHRDWHSLVAAVQRGFRDAVTELSVILAGSLRS